MIGQRKAPWIGRIPETQWLVLDFVGAAVLLALSVDGTVARQANFGAPIWLTAAASVLVAVPVAVRRWWPVTVFVVVLVANTVLAVLGVAGNPAVMVAIAMYTVSVSRSPRGAVPMLAASLVLTVSAEVVALEVSRLPVAGQAGLNLIAASVLVLAAACALGTAVRAQGLYAARTAEQATRRAVADERLRIARELHDVITHSMSLITVKASVANYLIESRPDEVSAALAVIETTGRSTLVEMRRMLGVLRADNGSSEPGQALDELAPAPGVADLAVLAGSAGQAGVRVDLDVRGDRELPDGVGLSVYRIVQEALTNVVKHAAPTTCRVVVDLTGQDVVINVTDDGHPRRVPITTANGHGIIGMRERTHLFGGEFAAGPVPHGGFRVSATLPLAATDPIEGTQRA